MSNTINEKTTSLSFLKQAANVITNGSISYINKVMPNTTDTLKEAKATVNEVTSTFSNTTGNVFPILRKLKSQISYKGILNWFYEKEDSFDSGVDIPSSYDDGSDFEMAEVQINQSEKNAKEISQTIVESSRHMVESEIASTANLTHTISAQTAVITSGFDSVNKNLENIAEIISKNTSAIIELQTASSKVELISRTQTDADESRKRMQSGKFNLSDYKAILKDNFANSELGLSLGTASGLLSNSGMIKDLLSPTNLLSVGISKAVDKASPNFRKNAKALDDAISETIMTSLIRLGESKKEVFGVNLGKIFGIDSSREKIDTSRQTLELHATPFDTLTKDTINSGITGYLRKILVAVGGDDVIYDARSRSFKTQKQLKKEYRAESINTSALYQATDRVKQNLGNEDFTKMMYSLMMNDLSNRTGPNGNARNQINQFKNFDVTYDYLKSLLGNNATSTDLDNIKVLAKRLGRLPTGYGEQDIMNQAAREAIKRNNKMKEYVINADNYGVDLSFINDSAKADANTIKKTFGRSDIEIKNSPSRISTLTNIDYTHKALYEIYRRLNKGINVFKVGENNRRSKPYTDWKDNYLSKPPGYKSKTINDADTTTNGILANMGRLDDGPNQLRNNTLEDGTTEELTGGQRFSRWGKQRGGEFIKAMFSGNPGDVKRVFGNIIQDVSGVASDKIKSQANKVNDKYGNASGYLKHKLFGTSYRYTNDEGKEVEIEKNDKGGYAGFIKKKLFGKLGDTNNSVQKWFKDVAGYFDYGNKEDKKNGVESKRKKLISTSIGALGGGLLAGPLGVLMGSMAGSAFSNFNIGDKFKEKLFGRDDNGKAKGLLTKVFDKMTRPITYQIKKTTNYFGNVLKKNIFGPLSDLGFAMRERMLHHVDGLMKKTMNFIKNSFIGKAFSAAKKKVGGAVKTGAKKVFGGLGNLLYGGSVGTLGLAARQTLNANTLLPRAGLNGLSNLLVHNTGTYEVDPDTGERVWVSGKDKLKQRREERNASIKRDMDRYSLFGGYAEYNRELDAKHATNKNELEQYIAEGTPKIVENTEQTNEILENLTDVNRESSEALQNLDRNSSEVGSLFTHDQGIHDKLDKLYAFLTGNTSTNKPSNTPEGHYKSDKKADDDSLKNALENKSSKAPTLIGGGNQSDPILGSALGSISTIAANNGLSNDEAQTTNETIAELSKDKPNKNSISAKLQKIININKTKSDEDDKDKKKKKSLFWDILGKIGNFAGGFLDKLLLILGGIAAFKLFCGDFEGVKDVVSRIGSGIDSIASFITGKSKDDGTTAGMNAVTSLADIQSDSPMSYAIPGAELYHNERDGAGNRIRNQNATKAKNTILIGANLKNAFMNKWHGTNNSSFTSIMARTRASISGRINNISSSVYNKLDNSVLGKFGLGRKIKNKASKIRDNSAAAQANQDQIANNNVTTVDNLKSRVGTAASLSFLSGAAGLGAKGIAKAFGRDEESQDRWSRIGSGGTALVLTANHGMSKLTGKKSLIDLFKELVSKLFKYLAGKFKENGILKKCASKVDDIFTGLDTKIFTGLKDKMIDIVSKKLLELGVVSSGEQALSAATLGIPIVVGGISGFIDGICGVEHLFSVLPGDADGTMKTISILLNTALGAAAFVPGVGYAVACIDIIDAIMSAIPVFKGKGLTQYLAELLYNIINGAKNLVTGKKSNKLKEAHAEVTRNTKAYNEKFGTNLSESDIIDATTNKGWWDALWHGKAYKGDNGLLVTDRAGNLLGKGGITNALFGNNKIYESDTEGNVLKNQYGEAVVKTDKYGLGSYKNNMKIGDYAKFGFNSAKRFFTGGEVYKTDEKGNVIYDENGNPIVDHKESNIFTRVFKEKKFLDEATTQSINTTKSFIKNIFKKETIKDENGNEILDENGKPIERSKAGNVIVKATNVINGALFGGIGGVFKALKKNEKEQYELDENGKPLLDADGNKVKKGTLGSVITKGLGKIGNTALSFLTGGALKDTELVKSVKNSKWFDTLSNMINGINKGGPENIANNISNAAKSIAYNAANVTKGAPTTEGGNPLDKEYKITSPFGPRKYPHTGEHHGVDLKPAGNMNTYADVFSRFSGVIEDIKSDVPNTDHAVMSQDGTWTYEGNNETGNMVSIRTKDGFLIKNMHLKQGTIPTNLKVGSEIQAGQKIGEMGNTGWSTGPHLHYQIQDQNGNYIDPTYTLLGTPNSKNGISGAINSVANVTASTITGSSYYPSASSDNQTTSGGILAEILSVIKDAGNSLLSKITGGLIGNSSSNNSDESSAYSTGVMSAENTMLTNSPNSDWVSIVRAVKQLVAAQAPVYNQSGYINITYNGRTVKTRTDCTGIIATMLKFYGVLPESTNITSRVLLTEGAIPNGFTKSPWPGWDKLVEGDIISRAGHAEIFAFNNGNKHMVYNGGSTNALASPGATYTGHKDGYDVIWRCNETSSINNLIPGMSNGVLGTGAELLFPQEYGHNETFEKEILKDKYDSPTHGWSPSSRQGQLRKDAIANNRLKPQNAFGLTNVATIDDRMLIATKENIGNQFPVNVGDHVDVQFTDGSVWNTMIGDIKGNDAPHPWGHNNGKDSVEIIYWDYKNNSGNQRKKVNKLVKTGGTYIPGAAPSKTDINNIGMIGGISNNLLQNITNAGINKANTSISDGTGGPVDSSTTINKQNYTSTKTQITKPKNNIVSINNIDSRSKSIESSKREVPTARSESASNNISNDNKEIIKLLYSIIDYLGSIDNNSGTSNELLNSINSSGFVDQGLRNELSSASELINKKRANKHTMNYKQTNPANNRMISNLARPV